MLDQYDILSDSCTSDVVRKQSNLLQDMKVEKQATGRRLFQVPDLCNSTSMVPFLNRKDVQAALPDESVPWDFCNGLISNTCYKTMCEFGFGDQDAVGPFTATRTLINNFAKGLGFNITSHYQPWWAANQIGGWTIQYGAKLLYATVRGAGHMVPTSRPAQGFQILTSFLRGINLPLNYHDYTA
ncbi:hypothetical protein Mapa_012597 [Marchantia paleacea]|nr:hypothetical protein Mapa_012597 [Marchantia paleacea]